MGMFTVKRIFHESILKYSLEREARMLNKLLRKEKKNKKATSLVGEYFRPEEKFHGRKAAALNKVYMQHVSEAIAIGRSSDLLYSLGIEITKVQLSDDRKFLKAYWICKNDEATEDIVLDALNKAAGDVKSEINNLRYMGKIPELRFVKDKEFMESREIEKLLSTADFGKDFQPSYPSPAFKSGPDSKYEEPLPEMRHDVLGLDHAKITRRLVASVDKEKMKLNLPKGEINFDAESYSSKKLIPFDKEIYKKFYKRNLIAEMKYKKEMMAKKFGDEEIGEDQYDEECENEGEYIHETEEEIEQSKYFKDSFVEDDFSKDWKPPFVK